MGHWRHGIEEEGVHHGLAVVVAPREAQVKGGANEREEKQREHGEGVAEPCVGVVGRLSKAAEERLSRKKVRQVIPSDIDCATEPSASTVDTLSSGQTPRPAEAKDATRLRLDFSDSPKRVKCRPRPLVPPLPLSEALLVPPDPPLKPSARSAEKFGFT